MWELRFIVSFYVYFLSVEKNELEYDKDYFGRHWTHEDEPTSFHGDQAYKDLEMDFEISSTLSSSHSL